MKRIISLAFIIALTGCVTGTRTTQILMQSTDDEMLPQLDILTKTNALVRAYKPPKGQITKKSSQMKMYKKSFPPSDLPRYTIQVVALSHNNGFNEYMNILPLNKPMWSNKKVVKGYPWYTLLYGSFNSKDHAQCVLDALPNNIKKHGPFIRSFSAIKSSASPVMTPLK